jgi:uncharacterized membrane-anchored protein
MTKNAQMMRKVPKVILIFWIVKVLTTAMGEATSDYLVKAIDPVIAVGLGGIALAIALMLQFAANKYVAWRYWLAVAMVAVFGTMAADVLHVKFGVPYVASTTFFAFVLAVVFLLWRSNEKTLSIHSINTRRREAFYWATVLATFALGTAAGDLTAVTLHLGYLVSGLVFLAVIVVPAIGYLRFKLDAVFGFWFAYIVTRPIGASFADWTGKARSAGGLGYGDALVSIVLTVVIVILVAYLQFSSIDIDPV